jgi:hypothetical protein
MSMVDKFKGYITVMAELDHAKKARETSPMTRFNANPFGPLTASSVPFAPGRQNPVAIDYEGRMRVATSDAVYFVAVTEPFCLQDMSPV